MNDKVKDKVKEILDFHRQKNPDGKIVAVTITRYYEIPAYSSTPPKELLKEWFEDFPPSRCHAFRDNSFLIEHFNDDAIIL